MQELQKLNSHLAANGPFLKGQDISSGDLALAPKLHHMQVALKEIKVSVQTCSSSVASYAVSLQFGQLWTD